MKYVYTLLALALLSAAKLNAQTNTVVSTNAPSASNIGTNAAAGEGKDYGSIELTLGGDGITDPKTGDTVFAFDVSVSSNPFKKLPNLWVGVEQAIAWEPTFLASTAVFSDWTINLYKEKLYINPGWRVGLDYGTRGKPTGNTGPELTLQYYTSDDAFIFAGANYNIVNRGNNNMPFFCGIGLSF